MFLASDVPLSYRSHSQPTSVLPKRENYPYQENKQTSNTNWYENGTFFFAEDSFRTVKYIFSNQFLYVLLSEKNLKPYKNRKKVIKKVWVHKSKCKALKTVPKNQ